MSAPRFDLAPNLADATGDIWWSGASLYEENTEVNAVSSSTFIGDRTVTNPLRSYAGHTLRVRGFQGRKNTAASTTLRLILKAVTSGDVSTVVYNETITPAATGVWVDFPTRTTVALPADTRDIFAEVTYSGSGSSDWTHKGLTVEDTTLIDRPLGDVLRLEVETDPTGLVNLVQNPSGDLGGWGWVTPVPASKLEGANDPYTHYQQGLKYSWTTANAGGQYFVSEPFDVAATQWLAAFWHVNYTPYGFHRARIDWLNSSQTLLSSSAWSSFTASYQDCNMPPVQAPASTAYAQIRFEVSQSAGAYPASTLTNSNFSVREVTVAKATTSAALAATLRTNLVTNPSMEVNTTGWSVLKNCTLARSTAQAHTGTASLAMTATETAAVARVTNKSLTSNIATLTVGAHYFRDSEPIMVSGVGAPFDGAATITGHGAATISFTKVAANVPSTAVTADTAKATSTGNPASPVSSWTVTNKSITAGIATLTVSATTMQARRDMGITVTGVGAPFDGSWIVDSSSSSKVSFVLPPGTPNMSTTAASGTVARNAANDIVEMIATTGNMTVTAGQQYTMQLRSRAAAAARSVRVGLSVFTSSGAILYAPGYTGTAVNNTTSGWTQATLTQTLGTVGTAYARAHIIVRAKAGEVHYADALMLEKATTVGTYFDGDTTDPGGTLSYQWTGTAHASTSTYNDSNLEFIEPVPYVDILGEVREVSFTTEELNVGTISAVVTSPDLDPAVADTLHPGRRFRFMAYNPATETFEPLIAGKLTNAKAEYFPQNPPEESVLVAVTGTNAITALANSSRSSAVATIAALPWVLEGCGVPWNVNGSGAQVASATVVLDNENASALDQVALARDTQLGYAWLDRSGVLQAHTTLPATVDWVLGEDTYNPNIVIDYDTDRLVNSVIVRRQWTHVTEGPQETVYGPYEDAASVKEWEVHRKEFNVAGTAPGSIPAYAASILAANAQPQVLVRSVQLPIRDTDSLRRAFVNLYDLAEVTNGDLIQQSRITGIRHELIATDDGGRWLVEVNFAADGGVATPTAQPPVQGAVVDETDGTWITPTMLNSWVAYGGGFPTAQYMRKNGVVYLRGLIKSGTNGASIFVLPVGYRPGGNSMFACIVNQVDETTGAASAGTAHTHPIPVGSVATRVDVNPSGTVVKQNTVAQNGYLSLAGISFPAEL